MIICSFVFARLTMLSLFIALIARRCVYCVLTLLSHLFIRVVKLFSTPIRAYVYVEYVYVTYILLTMFVVTLRVYVTLCSLLYIYTSIKDVTSLRCVV